MNIFYLNNTALFKIFSTTFKLLTMEGFYTYTTLTFKGSMTRSTSLCALISQAYWNPCVCLLPSSCIARVSKTILIA